MAENEIQVSSSPLVSETMQQEPWVILPTDHQSTDERQILFEFFLAQRIFVCFYVLTLKATLVYILQRQSQARRQIVQKSVREFGWDIKILLVTYW